MKKKMSAYMKRRLTRFREIENHLVIFGSGIDSIDKYVRRKLFVNNGFWICVIILVSIIRLFWKW